MTYIIHMYVNIGLNKKKTLKTYLFEAPLITITHTHIGCFSLWIVYLKFFLIF